MMIGTNISSRVANVPYCRNHTRCAKGIVHASIGRDLKIIPIRGSVIIVPIPSDNENVRYSGESIYKSCDDEGESGYGYNDSFGDNNMYHYGEANGYYDPCLDDCVYKSAIDNAEDQESSM